MSPHPDERQGAERAPQKPEREPRKARTPANDPGRCERVEQTLDDALADSFPASDPVSIVTSQREECWEETPEEDRNGDKVPAGRGR